MLHKFISWPGTNTHTQNISSSHKPETARYCKNSSSTHGIRVEHEHEHKRIESLNTKVSFFSSLFVFVSFFHIDGRSPMLKSFHTYLPFEKWFFLETIFSSVMHERQLTPAKRLLLLALVYYLMALKLFYRLYFLSTFSIMFDGFGIGS